MRVLVTGENGALSRQIKKILETEHKDVQVIPISVRGDEWESEARYDHVDAIIHCAGLIGDASTTEETYFKVNVSLTERVYKYAKANQIPHFVQVSSMAVYDATNWGFGQDGIITASTVPCASSKYGKSKLMGEKVLLNANSGDDSLLLSIIRAPSIVGKGMEAYFSNYKKLVNLPFGLRVFPEAKRSFVYVDTLIEFIYYVIQNKIDGVFFPQNLPMLSVCEICEEINIAKGSHKVCVRVPEWMICKKTARAWFSQICYAPDASREINEKVGKISSREAIRRCINEK